MDYRGIYTPSDQRSRPWRGQSFCGTREGAPCAPLLLRAHVFFDAQNLFHSVKTAYGYRYPNYDPVALATLACQRLGLRCDGVHFYTGIHDARVSPFWHAFWTRKLQVLGTRGVHVFSRRLAYATETVALPDGVPTTVRVAREKGIDVRIALDMVRLAREESYDVAVLFSSDQDLSEAISEIHRIRTDTSRWIKVYSAYPVADDGTHAPAVKGAAPLPITRAEYEGCIDPLDYRGAR